MLKLLLGLMAFVVVGVTLYDYLQKENVPSVKPEVHEAVEATPFLHKNKEEVAETVSVNIEERNSKVVAVHEEKDSHVSLGKAPASKKDEGSDKTEDIDAFEKSVADNFSSRSTYSGREYGIDDYNGDTVDTVDTVGASDNLSDSEWSDKDIPVE